MIRLVLLFLFLFSPQVWAEDAAVLTVNAEAALLGEIDTGLIMLDHNADVRRAPASLTKVMTLYLIYDALNAGTLKLEDMATVSEAAWKVGGSKTFVKVGDKVRVEDLIFGIAVQSGNDACTVMAEHLAGSEEAFVKLMNVKAKELGMSNTNFMNSNGLPHENHYSTARDLYLLAGAIIRDFPKYVHYSQEKQYTFNGIRQYNRNRLLWRDSSITGLKTGFTNESGYCLIATNNKEGQRLAAVILGAKSPKVREEEALKLLNHGNRTYETVRLYEPGTPIRQFKVWKGAEEQVDGVVKKPMIVTVPRKERGSLEVGLLFKEPIVAPIAVDGELGFLVVKLSGKEIAKQPVVAAKEVPEGNFIHVLWDAMRLRFEF